MASETPAETEARRAEAVSGRDWRAGVVGGLLGGVAMGVLMSFTMAGALEAAIPGLVGLEGGVAGWFVHLSISAVFGVLFAALMTEIPQLERYVENSSVVASLGAGYGVVLWVVAAGLAMPVWLAAVGGPSLPLPNLAAASFVAHLAYGFVLGATFPYLR